MLLAPQEARSPAPTGGHLCDPETVLLSREYDTHTLRGCVYLQGCGIAQSNKYVDSEESTMTRALLTEKERERIANPKKSDDQLRYEAISRVRRRIHEELTEDVEILRDNHEELLNELEEIVCEDT